MARPMPRPLNRRRRLQTAQVHRSRSRTLNLVPDPRGLDRFEARDRVVEEITAEGLAVMTTDDDPGLVGCMVPPRKRRVTHR